MNYDYTKVAEVYSVMLVTDRDGYISEREYLAFDSKEDAQECVDDWNQGFGDEGHTRASVSARGIYRFRRG